MKIRNSLSADLSLSFESGFKWPYNNDHTFLLTLILIIKDKPPQSDSTILGREYYGIIKCQFSYGVRIFCPCIILHLPDILFILFTKGYGFVMK